MKKSLSLPAANLLLLVVMLLMITVGSIIQMISLTWGLIATELFLILLPAVLLLRARRISLKEGLRLKPVSWQTGLLSVLLGVSIFLFTIFIEGIMMQITGMVPVSLPEGSLSKGILESTLYFIALAIAAPICEEALFRGAIQGAYENHRKAWFAILMTGLMFAFFHFRLSGLPALLPVAFIFGYVAWRTQSLIPGILIHFGMNATSATNTLVALNLTETGLPLTSPWIAVAGVVLTIGLLVAINRLHPASTAQSDTAPSTDTLVVPIKQPSWLATYWSLGAAGLLYLAVAGLTLLVTLFPEMTAMQGVSYSPSKLDSAIESRYQIKNRAGDVVGEANCKIEPQGKQIHLACSRAVQAYEAQTQTGFFSEDTNTALWSATWNAETLALQEYTYQLKSESGGSFSARLENGTLVTTSPEGQEQVKLPEGFLLELEWPWRAGNLKAQSGIAYRVPFGYLSQWNEAKKKSLPTSKQEMLRVYPLESVEVPAGRFDTSKVLVGGETSWYASGDNLRPVVFDDGMVTYQLMP